MPTLPAISRQQLALVGVAVTLGAALAACEKPAPGVTVFSGKHSDHSEAICWSPDADRAVSEADCSISLSSDNAKRVADQVPVIPTDAGATVGISVDPVVAEDGWVVSINSRSLTREPITEKYFRFTMPPEALRQGNASLVVQALTSNGEEIRGGWAFRLDGSVG